MNALQSMRKSFEEAVLADDAPLDRIVRLVQGATLPIVFGAVVAAAGLPLLPWGDTAALAWTGVGWLAAAGTHVTKKGSGSQAAWMVVAIASLLTIARAESLPTSLVAAGAFVLTIVRLMESKPHLYGMVFVVAVLSALVGAFDVHLVKSGELLFSGREWTPDRGMAESMKLSAFLLIAGTAQLAAWGERQQKERAERAERERAEAVTQERARIARELHDVVAHHVTAMTLQAEAAATAATPTPDAVRAVASSGREALAELRRMLGVLRKAGGDSPDVEPQPTLAELDRLAATGAPGVEVVVTRHGAVRPLPAGVELCAYRIIQEALTNTARHADATRIDVSLRYEPDSLVVEIADDGRPLATARVGGGGLGLVGMHERVVLLGGNLETGAGPDGGFTVRAQLPLGE